MTDGAGGVLVGLATVSVSALIDTDGNGAPDFPLCMDLDSDDLADYYETDTGVFVSASNTGSDPNNPDSDGDGILDGVEIAMGTDPNVANSPPNVPALPVVWPLLVGLLGAGSLGMRVERGQAKMRRGAGSIAASPPYRQGVIELPSDQRSLWSARCGSSRKRELRIHTARFQCRI